MASLSLGIEARFRPTDLYISAQSVLSLTSVSMALGKYLFSFRTQKSSSAAAIILRKWETSTMPNYTMTPGNTGGFVFPASLEQVSKLTCLLVSLQSKETILIGWSFSLLRRRLYISYPGLRLLRAGVFGAVGLGFVKMIQKTTNLADMVVFLYES